ncbi:hypothetical protein JOB18_045381 [Solea senegalensis]|uniref:Uncharacterized protein n=1 Tax=Solea senegalensis TaxID=28829 RepID=A0AAV6PL70_SOLSE|nr:transcription factor HIVEP2-like [Solea senegalensis]KAG7471442.1 hypothetical protein JOB18_045381 [Solea senegalensis]
MDEDFSVFSPDLSSPSSRLSSPGLDLSGCPSPNSPSSSPSARRYLSPRRDLSPHARHLSPRRDASPLRHVSPKRELGVGGFRRDVSPRRSHLSLLSPLSRPTSPGGRDYKRDLSPRGRHRGVIRPLSPRRGIHQHLLHQSQQNAARTLRTSHHTGASVQGESVGRRRTSVDMETELGTGLSPAGERRHGNRSSPPHQVLFSHLPLHSQLQVRSPYPMIPIGGIQMVQSVPASLTTPLSQQGAQLAAAAEDLTTGSDAAPPHYTSFIERGGGAGGGGGEWLRETSSPRLSLQEKEGGGVRQEQEEGIQTCTKAIASLCIDSEESAERRGGGGGRGGDEGRPPSSSSTSSLDSQLQLLHPSSVSPSPPGTQHFSGLELRPPHSSLPCSPHSSSSPSPAPGGIQPPPTASQPLKPEQETEITKRSKEAS